MRVISRPRSSIRRSDENIGSGGIPGEVQLALEEDEDEELFELDDEDEEVLLLALDLASSRLWMKWHLGP